MSITFNGTGSDSIGVIVERYPDRAIPSRRIGMQSVPGRNGDVPNNADISFPNTMQSYDVYFSGAAEGLPAVARRAAAWLTAPKTYATLWDSYEPDVFREAMLESGFDIENALNKLGRAKIVFNCKPQKFLTSGSAPITPTGGSVTNPTAFDAQPILTVSGSGDITINGKTITVKETVTNFVINCEDQEADDNGKIYCMEFPVLKPGANAITLASTITSFSMIPRWWVL